MNKVGLAEVVHEKIGGTKADAERAVDAIIDAIVTTLSGKGEVSIAGLGIFSTKARAARKARNPRTGEMVDVPAMKDRKSTRLNSSHQIISYAVFCLKKK